MDTRTCKIRTAAALCCCAAALAAAPAVRALFDQPRQAPAVAVFSKSEESGAVVTFSQEDFTSRLEGDDKLEGIVINSLPDQQAGVLKIAGRPLLCGEGVTADGLNTLSFEPADQEDSHASFSFIPVFSDYGTGDKSVAVNINLSDQPNSAPLAQAIEFETYVDLPCSGQLEASDAEGDPMTFCLVSQPKKGSVELTEDGQFCYTPLEGKAYSEKFTYCAIDQNGNASNPASVKITVKKQSAKQTVRYADLTDDPSHYAAIRLAETGVFSGENIGGGTAAGRRSDPQLGRGFRQFRPLLRRDGRCRRTKPPQRPSDSGRSGADALSSPIVERERITASKISSTRFCDKRLRALIFLRTSALCPLRSLEDCYSAPSSANG